MRQRGVRMQAASAASRQPHFSIAHHHKGTRHFERVASKCAWIRATCRADSLTLLVAWTEGEVWVAYQCEACANHLPEHLKGPCMKAFKGSVASSCQITCAISWGSTPYLRRHLRQVCVCSLGRFPTSTPSIAYTKSRRSIEVLHCRRLCTLEARTLWRRRKPTADAEHRNDRPWSRFASTRDDSFNRVHSR